MTVTDARRFLHSTDPAVRAQAERVLSARAERRRRTAPKRAASSAKKEGRRATKAESDRAAYEEIRERDAGLCTVQLAAAVLGECGGALQIDHQWGRGKEPTRVENCRMLCRDHHQRKTDGVPSRLMWLNDFREHALSHEYYGEVAKAEGQIALERAQHRTPSVPVRIEVK